MLALHRDDPAARAAGGDAWLARACAMAAFMESCLDNGLCISYINIYMRAHEHMVARVWHGCIHGKLLGQLPALSVHLYNIHKHIHMYVYIYVMYIHECMSIYLYIGKLLAASRSRPPLHHAAGGGICRSRHEQRWCSCLCMYHMYLSVTARAALVWA